MSDLTSGGNGSNGAVSVYGKDNEPLLQLLGRDTEAVIGAGQKNRPARLTMYNGAAEETVNVTTADAHLALGGGGVNGRVSVYGADREPAVELIAAVEECVIGLGQQNRPGRVSVYGANRSEMVRLDGKTGDIMIANADCAEEFDADPDGLDPGDVVVLRACGAVVRSTAAYDRSVAGVVSGAGSYRPALVLDRQSSRAGRVAVALLGKVFCRVEASAGPIRVGDILTTGTIPGCAMLAIEPWRAAGAIVGKALGEHSEGVGLIPVLVTLH